MVTDNFVIFKHFPVRGYWEISGYLYTTYLMNEVVLNENKMGMATMLALHGLNNIDSIMDTLVKYTKDPQDDLFIVNIYCEEKND